MKSDDLIVLVVLCASLILGVFLGAFVSKSNSQKEAIAHGAAQYNPTNGNFEWKESK